MEKKFSLKLTLTLMLLASALTCLVLWITIGREFGVFTERFGVVREYATLLRRIDELYIWDYDLSEVSNASKRAAVEALGDRWSYYMTPEEFTEHLDRSNNRFPGVGIAIIIDEESGGMNVLRVFPDSPAEVAGILAGDIIIGIDGDDITHLEFDEMRDLLVRPIDSTVDLSVLRINGEVETLTILYTWIFRNPVSYEMLDDGIGYLYLLNFDGGAADSFISAVEYLIEQGAVGLIFDVRSNVGGRVTELTRILDYLLPEGEIFISIDGSGREEIIMSGPEMVDIPAVVLVDRNSFSAAEYFAAILREYDYAYIVGEQTTGKSRSQRLVALPGGGALRISTAEYLTRNRVSLHDARGITPDYQISLDDEESMLFIMGSLENDYDPQLQKAVSVLRDML